jgi:hypothetical protein
LLLGRYCGALKAAISLDFTAVSFSNKRAEFSLRVEKYWFPRTTLAEGVQKTRKLFTQLHLLHSRASFYETIMQGLKIGILYVGN